MNIDTLNLPLGNTTRLDAKLVIYELLDHGGKVAHRDSSGRTALHIAAKFNNLVAAEILIAQGATIMPRDNSGKTPLDYAESAAMINFLESIRFHLVRDGLNVTIVNPGFVKTPLTDKNPFYMPFLTSPETPIAA